MTDCLSCDSGTYQTGSGVTSSVACTLCDAGTYQTGSGSWMQSECVLCDSGSYQTGSGIATSVQCTLCNSGTFQTGSGLDTSVGCLLCDAGTYQTGSGVSSSMRCSLCDSGTYQTGSGAIQSGDCTLCDAGTYQTGSGFQASITCLLCDAGTYNTGRGGVSSTYCTFCDAGTYQTGSGIDNATNCAFCASGTYQTGSGITTSDECTLCSSGTYQTGSGITEQTRCLLCTAGTYQTGLGATRSQSCDPCPAGTYDTALGLIAEVNCSLCAAGTYQTGVGIADVQGCHQCQAGTYQSGEGMVSVQNCTLCEATKLTDGPGKSDATDCKCAAGYYLSSGQVNCTLCTVCHSNATTIGSCDFGSVLDSVSCKCDPGFQGDGEQCTACSAGKYGVEGLCEECPDGSHSSPSSTSILDCKCISGYSGSNGGPCSACDVGEYKPSSGPGNCTQCPLNSTSTSGSSFCECSPGYSGSAPSCLQCPAGKYGAGGSAECITCKTCDSNATRSGSCPAGTGPLDGVICQCNRGYNGDGSSCTRQSLPDPKLLSIAPISGFCVKPDQEIVLQLKDFPAFFKQDLLVTWTLGDQVNTVLGKNVKISIVGGLMDSTTNLTITLESDGPANERFGFALFSLVLNIGVSIKTIEFPYEFRPYFVGRPDISSFSPSSAFVGRNLSLFLTLQNFSPTRRSLSSLAISVGGNQLGRDSISVLQSAISGTSLNIAGGPLTISGGLPVIVSATDSVGSQQRVDVTIKVEPIPPPIVLEETIFPRNGLSGSSKDPSNLIQIYVQYLPLDTPVQNISITRMSKLTNISANLKVIALTLLSSDCLDALCALHSISFELPSSADGIDVSSDVQLDFFASGMPMGKASYRYIANSQAVVDSFDPKSLFVTESGMKNITIFTKNFPTAGCTRNSSCQADLDTLSVTVTFGKLSGVVTAISDSGSFLIISCLSPVVNQAESVTVTVQGLSKSQRTKANLTFGFTYTVPPAIVKPVDGSSLGGTLLTVTALGWGDVSNRINSTDLVIVRCGTARRARRRWSVKSILSARSVASDSSVSVLVQSLAAPGTEDANSIVQCQIGNTLTSAVSNFSWSYYQRPTILSVAPTRATVGGYTGRGDGSFVDIVVTGFPNVAVLSDLSVVFKPSKGSSSNATVNSFSNAAGNLYLSVRVPPTEQIIDDKVSAISVEFPRPNFETRTAATVSTGPGISSFEYFVPKPAILSARWCRECNDGSVCIINGVCKNSVRPLVSQAALSQPGTLTILVQNLFNVSAGMSYPAHLAFTGSRLTNVSLSRVSSTFNVFGKFSTARLEFMLPNFTSVDQCIAGLVLNSDPAISLSTFKCIDTNIRATCISTSSFNTTLCAGPSTQRSSNFSIVARVFGPFEVRSVNEALSVTFDNVPAKASNIIHINTESQFFDVLIRPADFTLQSPSSSVNLVIAKLDNSASVSILWTFWRSPVVISARFDTLGTKLIITFDQTTNIGSMSKDDTNCSLIFNQSSMPLLNSNPSAGDSSCVWSSDQQQLVITLASGATVQPNDFLTLLPGRIQSANGLSPFIDAVDIYLNRPSLVLVPMINVAGPTTIDPCSPLTLYASGVSPRELTFQWSCSNDQKLDDVLRNLSPSTIIQLPQGTPDMTTLDKVYIISVTATDFLGTRSSPATIEVLKKGTAAPNVVFWPQSLVIFSNQPALLSSVAQFSQCPVPQDDLRFTWRFVTGTALSSSVQRLVRSWSSPQVFLPPNSLDAGGTYVFGVRLQAGGDSSKFSDATVSVVVQFLPVLAQIAGGDLFERSVLRSWSLDASPSRDLDKRPRQQQGLDFSWACNVFDGASLSPCTDKSGLPLVLTTKFQVLNITANVMAPTTDTPYLFSVTVQDSAGKKQPNTAQVSVYLFSTRIIEFTINLVSTNYMRGSQQIINSNDQLVLVADCQSSVSWTVAPAPGNRVRRQAYTTGFNSNYMIVAGGRGALVSGNSYKFKAECSDGEAKGSLSFSVQVNDEPSGGSCTACLVGRSNCQNSGSPISGIFRVSCTNWADQDAPLQFRFGYSKFPSDEITWSVADTPSFVETAFPSGQIDVYAEILDTFGASSGIIFVRRLRIERQRQSSARFLLQSGQVDWVGAAEELKKLSQKQSSKEMNSKIISLSLELFSEFEGGLVNSSASQSYSADMLSRARESLSFVPKTKENICASYIVVDSVTKSPKVLSVSSIVSAADVVNSSARDLTYLNNIDQPCTVSALNVLSNAMIALNITSLPTRLPREVQFVTLQSDAIAAIVFLFGVSLTPADLPLLRQSLIGSQSIVRRDQSNLGQELMIPINSTLFGTISAQASLTLPKNLSNEQLGPGGFNVYQKVVAFIPATGNNLIIRSPLIGMTLYPSNSSVPIRLQGLLQPINVTLPLQTMSDSEWLRFQQQAVCIYWDDVSGNYSSAGVQVKQINRSSAICESYRIADFLIVQNLSNVNLAQAIGSTSIQTTPSAFTQTISSAAASTSASGTVNMDDVLAVVGDSGSSNDSSWKLAKRPWIKFQINFLSFKLALAKVLRLVGGVSGTANASVTLIAVPGLIMKTIRGVSYSDFGMALDSAAPSAGVNNAAVISSVTIFTNVTNAAAVQLQGFMYNASTRRSGCPPGIEWRYTKVGEQPKFACNCPANLECDDKNLCTIIPKQGEQWHVVAIPVSVCNDQSSTSDDNTSTRLGLGLGLGLGLPIVALVLAGMYFSSTKTSKTPGKPEPQEPTPAAAAAPPSTRPVVPTAVQPPPEPIRPLPIHSQLVFDAKVPSEPLPAFRQIQQAETQLFSEQPPLQIASYWEQGWSKTHAGYFQSEEAPYMPMANPFDLSDPASRRYQI
uniref:GAIN-B domain-containing protein n=1 Tax=Cryptomonas curvata TaxID=233186 RepID=A0A7S0MAX3_9CRYP